MSNPAQGGNPMQMIAEFQNFAKSMHGKNPEQMVNELLSSGKMTQSQYQQLSQKANQFVQMAKMFGIK